jgi:hypothetical protein
VLDPSGGIATGEDAAEPLTDSERAKVRALIASLPLDALHAAGDSSLPANTRGVVRVDVHFHDGRYTNAAVAGYARGADNLPLITWIGAVNELADQTLFRTRFKRLAVAFDANAVRSIELETLGCYGPCSHYRVTFTNANAATIDGRCTATSSIPFARVLEASAGVRYLLPHYASNTIDAFGARITVWLLDGTSYTSEGYASKDWDDYFLVAETRLDQIVRDAAWSPPLNSPGCHGVLGHRVR